MRISLRHALVALPLLFPLTGWSGQPESLSLQTESKLWVEGGSTIKDWSCKAGSVDALVPVTSGEAIPELLGGTKTVKAVDVTVASEKLDCSNGTMNEHMKKALKVSEFPAIAFHVSSYDVTKGTDGVTGTLLGTLTLGGVKKTISVPATGTKEGSMLRVAGKYDLKMTDYDLTPPSLMFGRIKVRDQVTVKFDLVLKN